jgi:hypothetical protein
MGCDWIAYSDTIVGYMIDYDSAFAYTKYIFAYGEDNYDEDDCRLSEKACIQLCDGWFEYRKKFQPNLRPIPNLGFYTISDNYSGTYESHAIDYKLIWGYSLSKKESKLSLAKNDEVKDQLKWTFDFPAKSNEILSEFLAWFILKNKNKGDIASVEDIKAKADLIKSNIVFGVFGSLH